MRWGVPLLGDRVAPRGSCADTLLIVAVSRGRVVSQQRVAVSIRSPLELAGALAHHGIDGVACGGVSLDTRELLLAQDVELVENVACSAEEVVAALDSGSLCSGFGFASHPPALGPGSGSAAASRLQAPGKRATDCLACANRVCLAGVDCLRGASPQIAPVAHEQERWLETAADVAYEDERKLCRVAEVVYFALEMQFRRIGLAFCIELLEPCKILADVLSRFFEVVPVCCRVGGGSAAESHGLPCNPMLQAALLNEQATDLNLAAGLCIGADCVFNQASAAPVTTLFVKDKSLAHNPIGAVYSEYYLRETALPARRRSQRRLAEEGDAAGTAPAPRTGSLRETRS